MGTYLLSGDNKIEAENIVRFCLDAVCYVHGHIFKSYIPKKMCESIWRKLSQGQDKVHDKHLLGTRKLLFNHQIKAAELSVNATSKTKH